MSPPSPRGAPTATPGRADPLALAALILLAAALHLRDLTIGFPDRDLNALDAVLKTPLPLLLHPGTLPDGFTPVSRELYLALWGKWLALGPLGLHLVGAAIAIGLSRLLFDLGARAAGPRAGAIAVGLFWCFAPLGAMLSSPLAARDLIAAGLCAGALLLAWRGRWIAAGLAAGLAAAARETAILAPLVLLAVDLIRNPAATPDQRARRVAPAALAVALALIWVTTGSRLDLRSPAVGTLADFASAWFPGGWREGVGTAWRSAPWLVLAILVLAILAVPRRDGAPPAARPLALAGLALAVLGWVPVALLARPGAAGIFAVPAIGLCLAIGAWLARFPGGWARGAIALLALASLGANSVTRPPPRSPRRVAFESHARLRDQAAATAPLLDALRPLRPSLIDAPRVFAAGLPPDSATTLALGPGARVSLHAPALSIRFLAEFVPGDTAGAFGVLRIDPARPALRYEHADARVRARLGEGLLMFARYDAAAALYASAADARPGDAELAYPVVVALAAAGHPDAARARWSDLSRRGLFPAADTLAARLLAGPSAPVSDSARRAVAEAARAVTADPLAAAPHLELGRRLLAAGRARSATLEFATGSGIGRRSQDLFWLARGYDALGAEPEALEAYRVALTGGLDSLDFPIARRRLGELLSRSGGALPGDTP